MCEDKCAGGGLGNEWHREGIGTVWGHLKWSITVAFISLGTHAEGEAPHVHIDHHMTTMGFASRSLN